MKMLKKAELRTMLIYIQYTQYVDGVYKEAKHIYFFFLQWMHS